LVVLSKLQSVLWRSSVPSLFHRNDPWVGEVVGLSYPRVDEARCLGDDVERHWKWDDEATQREGDC
jgi:hypothetical protein